MKDDVYYKWFRRFISFKKLKMSPKRTFSNKARRLWKLPYGLCCMWLWHSNKIWCTVSGELHELQIGWGSRVNKWAWVRRVWPILSLWYTVSSLRVLKWFLFPCWMNGVIWKSLLWVWLSQWICQPWFIYFAIAGLNSWYEIGMFFTGQSRAVLAAWSAHSLPWIPMWLGNQKKTVVLF